jgi:hypothetical protein
MPKPVSPLQGGKVEITVVKASDNDRCSCPKGNGSHKLNPTCPVHGHGRPAGTIG